MRGSAELSFADSDQMAPGLKQSTSKRQLFAFEGRDCIGYQICSFSGNRQIEWEREGAKDGVLETRLRQYGSNHIHGPESKPKAIRMTGRYLIYVQVLRIGMKEIKCDQCPTWL